MQGICDAPLVHAAAMHTGIQFTLSKGTCASCAGDVNNIQVGDYTNIQDGVTVHVARHNPQGNVSPTIIGSNVTIGAEHAAEHDSAPCTHRQWQHH